jgi:FkbM family methyltransferase
MELTAHGQTVDLRWDDDTDHISRRIAEAGDFYERGLLEDAYERAPEGLVVDAGAHIGNHVLWFAGIMGRRVEAFEPHPTSFVQLCNNLNRNGLLSLVIAHRKALGAHAGRCTVTEPVMEHNSGSRCVVYGSGDTAVVALDDLFLDVAVLKVDVEGSAVPVLRGALGTIERCHPLLYIETGEDRYQVEALLSECGYQHQGQMCATPVHIYEAA